MLIERIVESVNLDKKIIRTLDPLDNIKDAIFLAGPTYRITKDSDIKKSYRYDIISTLRKLGFKGNIISPEWREDKKPSGWTYDKQIEWEKEALYLSSRVIFWIPRDLDKLPAFTTNIEFGEYFNKIDKIVIGAPDDAPKNEYLKTRCKMLDIKWHNTINQVCKEAIKFFNNKENIFFTSDTHFSQERTFELSKRPFYNVKEMDNNIISNWNSKISCNDIVYHLGDIGNIDILNKLNFKTLYCVLGNYERDDKALVKKLEKIDNVKIIYSGLNKIKYKNKDYEFELVHEPTKKLSSTNLGLFGHVHQLSMIKKDMLGVGIDAHHFYPIDFETILFYKNAIENFYDNDVYL